MLNNSAVGYCRTLSYQVAGLFYYIIYFIFYNSCAFLINNDVNIVAVLVTHGVNKQFILNFGEESSWKLFM
jgi:hypothetical protein